MAPSNNVRDGCVRSFCCSQGRALQGAQPSGRTDVRASSTMQCSRTPPGWCCVLAAAGITSASSVGSACGKYTAHRCTGFRATGAGACALSSTGRHGPWRQRVATQHLGVYDTVLMKLHDVSPSECLVSRIMRCMSPRSTLADTHDTYDHQHSHAAARIPACPSIVVY